MPNFIVTTKESWDVLVTYRVEDVEDVQEAIEAVEDTCVECSDFPYEFEFLETICHRIVVAKEN